MQRDLRLKYRYHTNNWKDTQMLRIKHENEGHAEVRVSMLGPLVVMFY